MKNNNNPKCLFCGNISHFAYKMDVYHIYQCVFCGTGFVYPMPDLETLKKLYNGFLQKLDERDVPRINKIALELFRELDLARGQNLKMLDVGGGGGFFSKAFEELGYGIATYVDLDPQSCNFAKNSLKLENVLNMDAALMDNRESFDFIYSRHVIEHLPVPTDLLSNLVNMLSEKGICVMQFPNADSLEYLAYTHLNILYRFNKIRTGNNYSFIRTLWLMISGKMLHGMDPPRHLWAISGKGIKQWAKRNCISCSYFARHLGDIPFSPGYVQGKTIKIRLADFIGQKILSPIRGGTHLIAVFRKTEF